MLPPYVDDRADVIKGFRSKLRTFPIMEMWEADRPLLLLNVLFAISLILGLASTVVAHSQLRTALQVQSATNWQDAAQVAGVSSQVFDRRFSGTGQL
jgi:hypothetical protein